MVATFLFLVCILGVTQHGTPTHLVGFAGVAIGMTLVAIHIVGINVTGVSVNPARSIGPALVGAASRSPEGVAQLWLFIIAPLIGAGGAGLLFRTGALARAATARRRRPRAEIPLSRSSRESGEGSMALPRRVGL